MIYFDNAATTLPKPPEVTEAMVTAMNNYGNPARGAHPAALNALRCIVQTREELATYFGLKNSTGVVFTQNATMALNIMISSIKGHIITTAAEHNSVLRPVYRQGNYTIIPIDKFGQLDINKIEQSILPDTEAIVMSHAANVTGNVYDIEAVGKICAKKGIHFIVDAAQTAGLIPIDMEAMEITALCFSGHKSLYGSQGTGGLCIRTEYIPKALIVGGSGVDSFSHEHPYYLPDALEAGTQNSHGIAGLKQGLAYVRNKNGACYKKSDELTRYFIENIRHLDSFLLYGDLDSSVRTPVVSLNCIDMDSTDLAYFLLSEHEVAVRAGVHCAPLMHQALGTEKTGAVRFSFSHYNTQREIDIAIKALETIHFNRGRRTCR